ncbi:nickel pincer cofactor biosynthesis protein LarB [Roseibacillus ishigakijimensis]|uniref:Nickel pincer cofactor biosynthesis protein LarB n=1 Tax=Roseibacillus ishigakijimensis TaxID=454146 RepID=A0A934RNN0_9BACT|nr:nickel pincer cofactor biosynthesis protein LarB [Roseibacillus ishigakijimensis]MBK1834130.1 nickel pincer cofactor biosynthesis protein LarB [Roseibacillus ishigakijimensis]
MNREAMQCLLAEVAAGERTVETALEDLVRLPYEELAHSTLDLQRELRQGSPEIILGENKTAGQIGDNLARLAGVHGKALATRVTQAKAEELLANWPGPESPVYHEAARCLTLGLPPRREPEEDEPYLVVVTAGTSDLPVAAEAAVTLQFLGHRFCEIQDVGVAGLHRLLPHLPTLRGASGVLAIAGMEGALPSVLGGLLACPVVAVPTSTGYGIARHGETALHAMLTSCAAGIAVMNIDNGFGAALFGHALMREIGKAKSLS